MSTHERIAGMPAATNYREMSVVFEAPLKKEKDAAKADLLLAATCAKGEGPMKCQLSVRFTPAHRMNMETSSLAVVKVQQPEGESPSKAAAPNGDAGQKQVTPKTPPAKKSGGKQPTGKGPAPAPAKKTPASPTVPSPPKGTKAAPSEGRPAPDPAPKKAPAEGGTEKKAPQPPPAKKAAAPTKASPKAPAGKKAPVGKK